MDTFGVKKKFPAPLCESRQIAQITQRNSELRAGKKYSTEHP